MNRNSRIRRAGLISSVSLGTILMTGACTTLETAADTICAKKAKIIEASQAVIDTLNAKCPFTEEEIHAMEPQP